MNKEKIAAWREDLHQIPELELDLPKTKAYLLSVLEPLGCTLSFPMESAILAWFDFGQDKTIALRTDMDALPGTEQTGAPYTSRHAGRMHACGHDGHMAMMLAVAHELDRWQTAPVNVLLIFQPGEESPGGARLLVEQDILETYGVSAVFGMHLWPMLEKGVVATRPGAMMARSSEVNVSIQGRASHAARYKEGADALEAGCAFVQRMYDFEKSLPDSVFRLLRFGRMEGGTIRNVVADACRIEGTLRAFEPEIFAQLKNQLFVCAARLEQELGVSFSFSFSTGYPAILNDEVLAGQILEKTGIVSLPKPEMISEDFSWYQSRVPGVFFFLGTGTGIPLHASDFDFDSGLLEAGSAFFLSLVSVAGSLAL